MKAVSRTTAQEVAYKRAFRSGRTFKTKLDALVTLENKRVEQAKRHESRRDDFSFCSGNFITGLADPQEMRVYAYSGRLDLDARPDFRPEPMVSGVRVPLVSG